MHGTVLVPSSTHMHGRAAGLRMALGDNTLLQKLGTCVIEFERMKRKYLVARTALQTKKQVRMREPREDGVTCHDPYDRGVEADAHG